MCYFLSFDVVFDVLTKVQTEGVQCDLNQTSARAFTTTQLKLT